MTICLHTSTGGSEGVNARVSFRPTSIVVTISSWRATCAGALLESCRSYVRVIVRRVLTTKGRIAFEDESDFVQEALMNASQNMATFRGRTLQEWLGWVRQISLRTSYRLIGGAGTPTPIPVAVYDPNTAGVSKSPSPSDCAIQIETVAQMVIVLGKLPKDMQTVLLGRVVDNMDYADIAQQLGRTSGASGSGSSSESRTPASSQRSNSAGGKTP